jgi:hypothetical protein
MISQSDMRHKLGAGGTATYIKFTVWRVVNRDISDCRQEQKNLRNKMASRLNPINAGHSTSSDWTVLDLHDAVLNTPQHLAAA